MPQNIRMFVMHTTKFGASHGCGNKNVNSSHDILLLSTTTNWQAIRTVQCSLNYTLAESNASRRCCAAHNGLPTETLSYTRYLHVEAIGL